MQIYCNIPKPQIFRVLFSLKSYRKMRFSHQIQLEFAIKKFPPPKLNKLGGGKLFSCDYFDTKKYILP